MSRAIPICLCVLLLAGLGRPPSDAAADPDAQERPNVLLIFTDDHRADALGAAGNPYIRTPALDSLAGTGFRMRNAYVMGGHHGAVCAPSRAMLMTGRSLFHVYDNLDSLRTFPQQLQAAGYRTFGTGKWHNSRPSFAKSFEEGRRIMFGGMSDHTEVPLVDMRPDGTYTGVDSLGFSTALFADAAIDFIDGYAEAETEAPFFAYVAFTAPHDPRTPPEDYLSAYSETGVPLPPNYMPAHPFNIGPQTMTVRDEHLAAWPRTPEVIRSQISEYYGLISHMDAEIGRILQALRRHGLAENTVVVVAGDNGLALGSHGLLGKQSLYEHSTRVPLIVAGPGVPRGESEALVYLYDVAPTIIELTGADGLEGMDGRSLADLWRGDRVEWRSAMFNAYANDVRSVREGRWKLISYPRIGHAQLFDLEGDPYELNNLADDPEYAATRSRMEEMLQSEQVRADDPLAPGAVLTGDEPVQPGDPLAFEFDYSDVQREVDRWQPDWVIEKYFVPDPAFVQDPPR
ncbi:MAG: sulfatase-like hydrolase/transferase [Rhodothermales bacterium]